MFYLSNPYKRNLPSLNLKVGQIAEKTIIAPFTYNVYKDETIIENEREKAEEQVIPVYMLSEEIKFNTHKNLNYIFQQISNYYLLYQDSLSIIKTQLMIDGYNFQDETIRYLKDKNNRNNVNNYLSERLNYYMDIGVYSDNFPRNSIDINRNGKIRNYQLNKLFSVKEALEKAVPNNRDEAFKNTVTNIIRYVIVSNIVYDDESTKNRRREARNNVNTVSRTVLKNEAIVYKNSRITQEEKEALDALNKARREKGLFEEDTKLLYGVGANFLIILLTLVTMFSMLVKKDDFIFRDFLAILLIYFATLFAGIMLSEIFHVNPLLIPFPAGIITVAFLYGTRSGLMLLLALMLSSAGLINWSIETSLTHFSISLAAICLIEQIKNNRRSKAIWLRLFLISILVNILFSILRFNTFTNILENIFYSILSLLISSFIFISIRSWLENILKFTTDRILFELMDFNHPLLKKLSQQAPGTYHHSLNVGTLAEAAADAIGANPKLVRVGSYYHDIGKLENPQIFTENNALSSDLHDKMTPAESAINIREHVSQGIALARQFKLPQSIIDIITQHHGEGKIKYFLAKAKESDQNINLDNFLYHGPNPRTKESALVMIADIIESTAKSMKDLNDESISQLFDDTVFDLIQNHMLDDTPISLNDIKKIKSYMLPILKGFYGRRIDYPKATVS